MRADEIQVAALAMADLPSVQSAASAAGTGVSEAEDFLLAAAVQDEIRTAARMISRHKYQNLIVTATSVAGMRAAPTRLSLRDFLALA